MAASIDIVPDADVAPGFGRASARTNSTLINGRRCPRLYRLSRGKATCNSFADRESDARTEMQCRRHPAGGSMRTRGLFRTRDEVFRIREPRNSASWRCRAWSPDLSAREL